MRKLLIVVLIVVAIGAYFHYIRGVDLWDVNLEGMTDRLYRDALQVIPEEEEVVRTGTRWEERKPMLTARSEIGAALIDGKIYVVGGLDGYGRTLRSMEIYDIETDTWSNGPSMPEARHHPAVTTDGEKLYVVGGLMGINFRPVDTAYVFDPATSRWSELGRLNDFRGGATAGYLDGRLHVTGGVDQAGPTGSTEVYDSEEGKWISAESLPVPREHLASAVHDGSWYVAAGRTRFPDGNLGALDAFGPDGAWTSLADVPTPRSGFGMAESGGGLFVFGGEGPEGTIPQVEEYDTGIGKWIPFGHLPTPRHGLAAVADGNRIYVIGGGKRAGYSVSDVNEVLIIE